ncbi:hypothetical protein Tco_1527857, partial [Tanacetum coccineum]
MEGRISKAQISESTFPIVKETIESCYEDPRVHVDDGCTVDVSDATLSIKSDKTTTY